MRVILAVEDGIMFDRSHARCMKLPFERGWDKWRVYEELDNHDLKFVAEYDTFPKADAAVQGVPYAEPISLELH